MRETIDNPELPLECKVDVRVRYSECDPMGFVHHAVYPVWMELARTELLRVRGHSYRDMEAKGIRLVVAKMELRYKRPAVYDDTLTVWVKALPTHGAKLVHEYEIQRGEELLVQATTTLVCIDEAGAMRRLPAEVTG